MTSSLINELIRDLAILMAKSLISALLWLLLIISFLLLK